MPIVIAVLIALAIGFSGGLKWQDGKVARAEAKLEKAEGKLAKAGDLAKWNLDQSNGWMKAKKACEAERDAEVERALASVNAALNACQARVDQTNRSRDNLARLLANAPKRDPKGCAARDDLVMLKDLVR
jgi:hypothetical protein